MLIKNLLRSNINIRDKKKSSFFQSLCSPSQKTAIQHLGYFKYSLIIIHTLKKLFFNKTKMESPLKKPILFTTLLFLAICVGTTKTIGSLGQESLPEESWVLPRQPQTHVSISGTIKENTSLTQFHQLQMANKTRIIQVRVCVKSQKKITLQISIPELEIHWQPITKDSSPIYCFPFPISLSLAEDKLDIPFADELDGKAQTFRVITNVDSDGDIITNSAKNLFTVDLHNLNVIPNTHESKNTSISSNVQIKSNKPLIVNGFYFANRQFFITTSTGRSFLLPNLILKSGSIPSFLKALPSVLPNNAAVTLSTKPAEQEKTNTTTLFVSITQ